MCRNHPAAVKTFFEKLEPLFCVLSAIDHILLPHQYQQMEQVRRRLSRAEVDNPDLVDDLWPSFCLPFPIIQVLSNYSRPTAPYKQASRQRDWVVHAQFGDFSPGMVELPACPHTGVCEPGTVTAVMARYIPHGFPPVAGERFILTQSFSNPLVHYVGLSDLPVGASASIENVVTAASTEDDNIVALKRIDSQVYEWKTSGIQEHFCACCWEVPTITRVRYIP